MRRVAALFVETNGAYFGLDGVDPWDETRDARLYAGPWPVVAHPPCQRWCRFAKGIAAQYPEYQVGDDGGCFAAALEAVIAYGGVLEHPAGSLAWDRYGLPKPASSGGWTTSFDDPGASCYVEQGRYGHRARKATWLYAYGVELPALRWGRRIDGEIGALKWGSNLYGAETYWIPAAAVRERAPEDPRRFPRRAARHGTYRFVPDERIGAIRSMTFALVLFVLATATANARPQRITLDGPKWVPPLIRRLAVCETRGNPQHQSGSYGGIVGWYVGTWQLDRFRGMPRYPWNATIEQQVRVAVKSVYVEHRYFGCLHGPEHAWVRG